MVVLALALPSVPAITSAFLLKLTTSLDDLLWLSPFLSLSPSAPNKFKHSVVYFFICIIVTMIAFIFGTSLLALTSSGSDGKSHGYWNPERFLSLFSASVLCYIARNDYIEWKEENYSKSNSNSNSKPASSRAEVALRTGHIETVEMTSTLNKSKQQLRSRSYAASKSRKRGSFDDPEVPASSGEDYNSGSNIGSVDSDSDSFEDSDDEEIQIKIEEASKSLRRFVTVCVMGTLDDMIVFSAFVAGGAGNNSNNNGTAPDAMKDNYLALFIGTTFAALLIVTVSWFFSEIECFKRIVKKIPMWALLTGIAVYILIMGLI